MCCSGSTQWPELFRPDMRGIIAAGFYQCVREGSPDAESVLICAEEKLTLRYTAASPDRRPDYEQALRSLRDDRGGALEFAQHALWRESLSPAERERLRREAKRRGLNAVLGDREGRG